jgi:adenylyltransferase/sulfurtransferase
VVDELVTAGGRNGREDWWLRAAARVDAEVPAVELPRALVLELFAHARESYPEECCGLIVGAGSPAQWRAVRCSNVQSARKARGESELDARDAFWMDEGELLSALRAVEATGESVQAIYHSHVDAAAYLSHIDVRNATGPSGRPIWPGLVHVVVSVFEAGARDAAWFEWDDASGRFRGRRIREN